MGRKIIGITVGSPLPKSNLAQTDPTKGDFVKGKDIIPTKLADLEDGAVVGDISTALDTIIEIQNSYINGGGTA